MRKMWRIPCAVVVSVAGLCAAATPGFAEQGAAGGPPAATPVAAKPVAPASPDIDAVREELDRLREEFAAVRRQYDERLVALEERLVALAVLPGGTTPAVAAVAPVPAPPPQDPAAAPPQAAPPQVLSGGVARGSNAFNPDTSIIGNFVAAGGSNPLSTQPPLQLTEAEAAFQAIIDPYARADFFLAASPEGLEVEEGFITFTALPSNLLLKAGKMRASFGKVNLLHTHAMPTADRPLVTENLLGGEEGLSDSGVSLSRLIRNPYIFLEAIGEVYTGSSAVFQTSERSRLNYLARVRAYRDITEDKNIDLGASFAYGPTEGLAPPEVLGDLAGDLVVGGDRLPKLNKRLFGIDATFRYRPLRMAIYRRLNLRTELIWSRQDLGGDLTTTAFGMYGLGEYQFARRWYAGARVDRSARAFDGDVHDTGASVFVTFWPTEFSQIRTQYRRTNYAESVKANEVFLQFNFSIGAHGAHAF